MQLRRVTLVALLASCGGNLQAVPPESAKKQRRAATVKALSPMEVVSSPDRSSYDRRLDALYQPVHFLRFLSLQPGDRVAELATGDGYFTELFARTVGDGGQVFSRVGPAAAGGDAPRQAWEARMAEKWSRIVVPLKRAWESPLPEQASELRLVVLVGYHRAIAEQADRARMNLAVYDALEGGGHYVVLDHRAAQGAGLAAASSLGRVEPDLVREEVEVAGFDLVETGDFLQNPQDDLKQPSHRLSVPTDRFVLRFQKAGPASSARPSGAANAGPSGH